MKSLMLNGIGFITGDPTLKIDYPYWAHPAIRVKAITVKDQKSINLMLPLHKGDTITAVKVSYKNSNARSFISQIRLTKQLHPSVATVQHDDGTDLLSIVPDTRTSIVKNVVVSDSMVLTLYLNFSNIADIIEIGAVEIVYQ